MILLFSQEIILKVRVNRDYNFEHTLVAVVMYAVNYTDFSLSVYLPS